MRISILKKPWWVLGVCLESSLPERSYKQSLQRDSWAKQHKPFRSVAGRSGFHHLNPTVFQQVTYLTHACMDLKLGDKRMVFDPWLMGPAFARGWWLLHEPPSDWLERLCRADLIYISHMHSDHLR